MKLGAKVLDNPAKQVDLDESVDDYGMALE
jgi:hypothetical protein